MKDFNIAKYLKENHLGSHAILGAYVDLHNLKEEEEVELDTEIPYEGPEHKLDGFGDEFVQDSPVEEEMAISDSGVEMEEADYDGEVDKYNRMMGLAHEYFEKVSPIVRKTIDSLRNDGFDDQDIIDFLSTDWNQ